MGTPGPCQQRAEQQDRSAQPSNQGAVRRMRSNRRSADTKGRRADAFNFGANVDLIMLDQRQYRDDQPCNDDTVAPCPGFDAPRAHASIRRPHSSLMGSSDPSSGFVRRNIERSSRTAPRQSTQSGSAGRSEIRKSPAPSGSTAKRRARGRHSRAQAWPWAAAYGWHRPESGWRP